MTYNKYDVAKVSILLILLLIISYTALQKFVLNNIYDKNYINPKQIFQLFENYDVCNKIKDNDIQLRNNCYHDFQISYKKAEIKCNGYMKNFINCKNNNNKQQSKCQLEYSNVASCIDSVMYDVNEQYSPSSLPSTSLSYKK